MQRIVPQNAILIPPNAKRVFEGIMFDVYQWPQKLFDDTTVTYEMLRRPDTAQIIAIKDGKFVVINEQQAGRPAFLRFPGGRVEPGESWEEAAARECKEELGLSFANWRLVDVVQPFTKLDWFVANLVTTDVTEEAEATPEGGEKIEVLYLTLDELKARLNKEQNPLLNYEKPLFDRLQSIEELLALPEYKGKLVER
jgi:ADP-ribose pyrophosphatase